MIAEANAWVFDDAAFWGTVGECQRVQPQHGILADHGVPQAGQSERRCISNEVLVIPSDQAPVQHPPAYLRWQATEVIDHLECAHLPGDSFEAPMSCSV
ncbi:hypothetical protein [Actinophytocola sp.]|uniref:hypothetical protein n=1 Tax=Actinophytocola sp. TaxID=1872138 RepID=UPI002D7FD615|nr:hypothetical protein [Actinophytocola sp.]HET9139243.1 hypothetical protein [Actinophytocola sp.]